MKKLKYLLISLILMIPTVVEAEVNQDNTVRLYDTEAECRAELAKNDRTANASATNGYYLSCKVVSCENDYISHNDIEPFQDNVTCANGNPYPYKRLFATSISSEHALVNGAPCSLDEQDENYFEKIQYATFIDQYNCLLRADESEYNTVPTTTTTTTAPSNNTTNPQTGINTYYIILGSTVVILSIGLYVINKKNLFKKI